ncbi:MAG: lysophospholipid acyltransferase family protein [Burkholderiales bacterium]
MDKDKPAPAPAGAWLPALLRSCAYALLWIAITPPFAILSLLTFPLPLRLRYRIITQWSRIMTAAATGLCGIRYRVLGREHLPERPAVILSKHQSAWETLAYQVIFPPQVWVMKRELLWIPFFGWGLAMLAPIAINRGSALRAMRKLLADGRDRLRRGFWIIVFPEGTRVAVGARRPYHPGGAAMALHAQALVVPVAHNAGRVWRKNAFIKYPGTITVSIGPAIAPEGLNAAQLTAQAEAWIEAESARLAAD